MYESYLDSLKNTFIPGKRETTGWTVIDVEYDRIIFQRSNDNSFVMLPKSILIEYLKAWEAKKINIFGKSTNCREYFSKGVGHSEWDKFTHGQDAIIVSTVRYMVSNNLLKYNPVSVLQKVGKQSPRPATPQLILQGPPGTGKSHYLKQKLQEYGLTDESPQVERIVGHPELTSADFIGTYRPYTNNEGRLNYNFVMGPFTRLLKKALKNKDQAHILVIEELNRCNAAAMFAEVFQLLDRDDDGYSEYATSLGQDVNKALGLEAGAKVKLPPNLAIWATINTADQGVFPMDTAFKRRWSFKYLGVNTGEEEWKKPEWNPEVPKCGSLTWQSLRLGLNAALASVGIDEDRHLGGFFLSKRELKSDRVVESISTKVIGYLRDDVLRYEPQLLFKSEKGHVPGFSRLLTQMEADGVLSVFNSSVSALKFKDATKTEVSFQQVLKDFDAQRSTQEQTQDQSVKDDATEQTNETGAEEANQAGGAQ